MAPATSWISSKKRVGTWLFLVALAVAAGLAACDNGSTDPAGQRPDATELFPGLTVSDANGPGAGYALAAATAGLTYVSACPGTFSDGDEVTITNLANSESKTVPVVDGGFDPVTLEAEPGDELEIIVHHSDGSTSRFLTRVPPRKRPRVVRTVPPKDATDVVLSASALVVFSEPIDGTTVTAENIRLLLDGDPVAGTLALRDDGLIADLTPVETLEAGAEYTLVITTGLLDLNGDGLEEDVQVSFSTRTWVVSVSAGWFHTCALTLDSAAYCWGANWWGQLGRQVHNNEQSAMPVLTAAKFASVAAGYAHTCGLTASGQAYCWGGNSAGELGDGTTADRYQPAPVIGGHGFVSLTAGYKHTCAITQSGTAYCWGINDSGELGIPQGAASFCGGWPCSPEPVPVSGALRFVSIAGGHYHVCGLTASGKAYCWGWNSAYGLGSTESETCLDIDNNPSPCSTTPVAVSGGLSFASLSAGGSHSCGLTASGAGYCWGGNNFGQLGNGEPGGGPDSYQPVAVVGGQSFASIVAGQYHTCALTRAGQAFCWGNNAAGRLGIGEQAGPYVFTEPMAVTGDHVFKAVATSFDHTCALSSDRSVYCWGSDGFSSEFSPRRVRYLP